MQKGTRSPEYVLSIPYSSDAELARIIYDDILGEASSTADHCHCFIEADVRSLEDRTATGDAAWPHRPAAGNLQPLKWILRSDACQRPNTVFMPPV